MRINCQILLKSPPINLLAGSTPGHDRILWRGVPQVNYWARKLCSLCPRQRWADCHFLQPRSSPGFLKLSPCRSIVQKIWKCNSQVQIKSKNLRKTGFPQQKCRNSFPLIPSKSGPDQKFWNDSNAGSNPNLMKIVIVRIQTNAHFWYTLGSR